MLKHSVKNIRPVVATGLLLLTLGSTPASASHNSHGYMAPLAAFVAFSWLTHRSSHHHYQRHNYHNQSRHYQGHKRRHSHSSGSSRKRHSYSH